MAPASFVGPVVYNEQRQVQESRLRRDRQGSSRSQRASRRTRRASDNGWIGMIEHYFVAAWLPPERRSCSGSSTRRSSTTASTRRVSASPRRRSRRARTGGSCARACTSARRTRMLLAKLAPGPRSRRRLRHLHDHRGAAVLAAQVAARPDRQLGLGDHRHDDHDQGRVLSR